MNRTFSTIGRVILGVHLLGFSPAGAQIAAGPSSGSVPRGTLFSTETAGFANRTTTGGPGAAEPPLIRPSPSPPWPQNSGAGVLPAASNHHLDRAASSSDFPSLPYPLESFPGIPATSSFPPDPVLAVGPHHLMLAVNKVIRISDRFGQTLRTIDAAAWFGSILPGADPFDPRVLYDPDAARWIMLWHHHSVNPDASYYLVAVSDDEDPIGTWTTWALPADLNGGEFSGEWSDNGCLGLDAEAVYIVSDQVSYTTGVITSERVRIVRKRDLYAAGAGPLEWNDFWNLRHPSGSPASRVRPAVVHQPGPGGFLLEIPEDLNGSSIILYRITGVMQTPTIDAVEIPVLPWRRAPDADQKGFGVLIDGGGSGLMSEVQVGGGFLWAVHSIANPADPAFSALRVLAIRLLDRTVTMDFSFGLAGNWYLYPAIAADSAQNVMVTYTRSGFNEYAGLCATWRMAGDSPGLRGSVVLQKGWANYQWLDANRENRWGDYSAATIDPSDPFRFWMMGEYAETPADGWGTWVTSARLLPYPGPKAVADRHDVDFGDVEIGGAGDTAIVTFFNAGSAPLTVSGMTTSTGRFAATAGTPLPIAVEPSSGRLQCQVVFAPGGTGAAVDSLIVATSEPDNPALAIPLRGNGVQTTRADSTSIYAVQTRPSGSYLWRLNANGTETPIGQLAPRNVQSLSIDPASGLLIGSAPASRGTITFRIDADSAFCRGSRTLPVIDLNAVISSDDHVLWGGTSNGEILGGLSDVSEGTLIATVQGGNIMGLLYDSQRSRFWATNGASYGNDTLYSVDRGTGSVRAVGSSGLRVRTSSLTNGPAGRLCGLVENAIVTIDTATGRATIERLIPLEGLVGIASVGGGGEATMVPRDAVGLPETLTLGPNYPNPFNGQTHFTYVLPARTHVRLEVFTILGQKVAEVVNAEEEAGRHIVRFTADGLASGAYVCRLQAGGAVRSRMILLNR